MQVMQSELQLIEGQRLWHEFCAMGSTVAMIRAVASSKSLTAVKPSGVMAIRIDRKAADEVNFQFGELSPMDIQGAG